VIRKEILAKAFAINDKGEGGNNQGGGYCDSDSMLEKHEAVVYAGNDNNGKD
jgi:hypothetical protein